MGSSTFHLRAANQQLLTVIRVAANFDTDLAAQRATEVWRTARGSGHLPVPNSASVQRSTAHAVRILAELASDPAVSPTLGPEDAASGLQPEP